ncbi:MAG: hypothetical protein GEV06_06580 [Luteitalea sp.]|nr:hypothetical protein [Luteitalea sp.]
MIPSARHLVAALLIGLPLVGCNDDSPSGPGVPVFLSGVWRGTISLNVGAEPPVDGEVSCLFTPRAGGDEPRADAACNIQSEWLNTSFGGEVVLDDADPPTPLRLDTTYSSPRGCSGTLHLEGEATESRVTATARGVDCDELPWTANLLLTEAP